MSGYIEAYTRTGKKGRRVLDSKLYIALIIGIVVGTARGYVVAKATPDTKDCISILDQEATKEMQNSEARQKDFQKKRQQMLQNLLDDLEQKTE